MFKACFKIIKPRELKSHEVIDQRDSGYYSQLKIGGKYKCLICSEKNKRFVNQAELKKHLAEHTRGDLALFGYSSLLIDTLLLNPKFLQYEKKVKNLAQIYQNCEEVSCGPSQNQPISSLLSEDDRLALKRMHIQNQRRKLDEEQGQQYESSWAQISVSDFNLMQALYNCKHFSKYLDEHLGFRRAFFQMLKSVIELPVLEYNLLLTQMYLTKTINSMNPSSSQKAGYLKIIEYSQNPSRVLAEVLFVVNQEISSFFLRRRVRAKKQFPSSFYVVNYYFQFVSFENLTPTSSSIYFICSDLKVLLRGFFSQFLIREDCALKLMYSAQLVQFLNPFNNLGEALREG